MSVTAKKPMNNPKQFHAKKTIVMSKETISYGPHDPEQDKRIAAKAETIKAGARKDGAFFARKNRPTLNEASLLPYVGRYGTAFQEVLAKEIGELKPQMQQTKFNRFKEEMAREEAEVDAHIEKIEHANHLDTRSLDGQPKPEIKKRNPLFAVLLGIIYLGEFYYNALAFAYLGGNPIGAYLIGATVTLVEGILAFATGKNLVRIEQGDRSRYLQTGLFILINLGIVIAMSTLRARMSEGSQMQTPSWIFFLVNIAFLAGSIVFSKFFFPSQKDTDASRDIAERHCIIEERKAEIKQLQARKAELKKAFEEEEKTYLYVMSLVKSIEEQIDAHYREAVELFKTENLITRSDLGTPVCFFEPVPSLVSIKNV